MKLKKDHLIQISKDIAEKTNVVDKNPEAYDKLKSAIVKFNSIQSDKVVAPYGEGRKGFVAPKEWQIDK